MQTLSWDYSSGQIYCLIGNAASGDGHLLIDDGLTLGPQGNKWGAQNDHNVGSSAGVYMTSDVPTSTWFMVIVTHNATTHAWNWYYNGVADGSGTGGTNEPSTGAFNFFNYDLHNAYSGQYNVTQILFYNNTVLNSTQVTNIYNTLGHP